MDTNLIITKIHTVFEGEFNPGIFEKKKIGRHSNCFVYFLYGKAKYTFKDHSFVVSPKNFFFLAKDSIYSIEIFEKTKYVCVDFDFSPSDVPIISSRFENVAPSIKSEFTKLFYVWNNKSRWHSPQTFEIVYSLYSEAIKAANKEYAKQSELFASATSFIFKHYTEPDFSVQDIANHLNISEVHLRRIFKFSVHTSPKKYINYLRLEKAKNMLHLSNFSISEIASSIGFDDPFYFSKLFKKETGLSPTEFRTQHLELLIK